TWGSLLALAEIYSDTGVLDRALICATRAHQLIPHEPELLFVLALIAAKRGQAAESVQWARETMASGPGHWESQARRLLLDLAESSGDVGLQMEALAGDVAGLGPSDVASKLAQLALSQP